MSEKTNRAIVPAASKLPAERLLHPLVEKMLGMSPNVETAEKLMKMQEEWERNNAKRAFTTALVALKGDLPTTILKDKKADLGTGRAQYTFASLANVMKAITPALTKHGFSVSTPATSAPDPNTKQTVITVTATITHHAGHSEQTVLSGPVDVSGSKQPIQGIGSSITYLQRYAVLSLLGIATEDMKDPEGKKKIPDAETVDPEKNLRALRFCTDNGKTKAQVEAYLKKPVAEWTLTDLERLRPWMFPTSAKAAAAAKQAETNRPKPETKAPPRETKPATDKTPSPAREPGADEGEDLGVNLEFHCPEPGCGYHNADEGLFADHGLATGHKTQPPSAGGLFDKNTRRR